jgi:predicted nucleic acid-binding protein
LPITSLTRFELCNAIGLSVFRKLLDRRIALLRQRASKAGHRAMDLLHLASALTLGATDFLTFDQNQAEVATVLGVTVKP